MTAYYICGAVGLFAGIAIGMLIARSVPQTLRLTIIQKVVEDEDSADAWKEGRS